MLVSAIVARMSAASGAEPERPQPTTQAATATAVTTGATAPSQASHPRERRLVLHTFMNLRVDPYSATRPAVERVNKE
jgi:hypothetical protein